MSAIQEPTTSDKPTGVWVRLHLERQSDSSFMPPFVTGFLTKETATAYVLTQVLEPEENEETFEVEMVAVNKHHHINRTYVWDCEVLGAMPSGAQPYNGQGGLG